jgi:hypothetical protein
MTPARSQPRRRSHELTALAGYDIYQQIMFWRASYPIRCTCCRPSKGLAHRAGVDEAM